MPLYPHQTTGAEWLAQRRRAALCDEQGLGKTITALEATGKLGALNTRVLVLAPSVVVWNWAREAATWMPGASVQVITESRQQIDRAAHVVVTTHGLILRTALRVQLLQRPWTLLIVDEVHAFKSGRAQRTQALYGIPGRDDVPSLVNRAEFVWVLTGTPVPNDVSELYPMLRALWPGEVRWSFNAFRSRFCDTVRSKYGDGIKVVGNKRSALPELRRLLEGKMLRRLKKDVLRDLPPVRFEIVTLRPTKMPQQFAAIDVELSPVIRRCLEAAPGVKESWAAFRDLMLGKVTDDDGKAITPEVLARYRRLCGLAKADAAVELLTGELRDRTLGKVVVFAHHTQVVHALIRGLQWFGVVAITGETPPKLRQLNVDRFQTEAETRVLVANIVAGGTGVTLTAAADAVFVELSYVPAENAQAADRIHRIGQKARSVRVRFIALAGTVDEMVTAALQRKTKMIRELLQ